MSDERRASGEKMTIADVIKVNDKVKRPVSRHERKMHAASRGVI